MALPAEAERKWSVSVDPAVCAQCPTCLSSQVCRARSFISYADGTRKVMMARCWGCFDCADACPYEAVVVEKH